MFVAVAYAWVQSGMPFGRGGMKIRMSSTNQMAMIESQKMRMDMKTRAVSKNMNPADLLPHCWVSFTKIAPSHENR